MAERLNTAQAIGALTAQVEAMNNRLDRDREDRQTHDQAADAVRKEVLEGMAKLERSHDDMLRRVDKIEPVADMITNGKAKITGGAIVIGVIGTIVLGFLSFFKEQLLGFFGW